MLKALYYCHKVVKVIHRDIKPDNIMINHNNEAVLIDFGVSAIVEDQENDALGENRGSQLFFAPEMFNKGANKKHQVRGEKTDLWALGVTLYYLLAGRYPAHEATNPLELKEIVCSKEVNFDYIKSDGAKNLLKKILIKDPNTRATLDDILKDDWVTHHGKETIQLNEAEYDDLDNTGKKGFGNLKRLLKSKALGQGSTSKDLFARQSTAQFFNDDPANQLVEIAEEEEGPDGAAAASTNKQSAAASLL